MALETLTATRKFQIQNLNHETTFLSARHGRMRRPVVFLRTKTIAKSKRCIPTTRQPVTTSMSFAECGKSGLRCNNTDLLIGQRG
jgi:hypothetical protein